MTYSAALVRILPQARAEDFLRGLLYFNTAAFFGRIDRTDQVRFDCHDGIDEAIQAAKLEVLGDNDEWLDLGGINNPITVRSAASEWLNVLCLYAMTDREGDAFDERNLAFGNTAILINNLPKFFERLQVAATRERKSIGGGPIEYVDKATYHGRMGPFRKFKEHSYQNEYRVIIGGGDGNACRLDVGDLRDISSVLPSTDIPRLWAAIRSRGA